MAGGLVEEQDARPAVERAGEQDALLLAPGEHRSHVSDQGVVLHRHRGDVVVHRGEAGARLNALRVRGVGEEGDVLGDGAGEELVVLHHARDQRAVSAEAEAREWHAVDLYRAADGFEQAEQELHQRGLAAAGRADDRDRLARIHLEAHAVQHRRVGLAVAEAEAAHRDPALYRFVRRRIEVRCRRGLLRAQGDIGDALHMQAEEAELDQLLDQAREALHELRLVGDEREQHADGEGRTGACIQHQARAQPHRDDALDAEHKAVESGEQDAEALGADAGIEGIHGEVLPLCETWRLMAGEAYRLHAAQRLEEVALLARAAHDVLLGGEPHRAVEQHPADREEGGGGEHHQRELHAVEQHHRERDDHHQPVDHCLQKAAREGALDDVHRLEARRHVADVALLEPRHRQADEMAEEVGDELQVEAGAQHHQHPAAQCGDPDLQQREQQEAHAQHGDQVAVGGDEGVVHHPLHVERADEEQQLQHQRQRQHLRECTGKAGQAPDEGAQAQRGALRLRLEARRWRELQRHPAERARGLGERQAAASAGRVVDGDAVAVGAHQHHEVVQPPVQQAGQAQLAELV